VFWYVLFGVLGAPFFAGGCGLSHLAGSTGGYIWGFFISAYIIGFSKKHGYSGILIYLAAALALYIPGLLQLWFVTKANFASVLAMGFYPFVFFDGVKALIAFLGVGALRKIFSRITS